MRVLLSLALIATATFTHAQDAALPLPPPLSDANFPQFSAAEVALGELLFWDPVISGNRNISCATCHHPRFGTSDGVSLGIGEGGIGLGPDRLGDPANYPEQRIPRNAPALWNIGADIYMALFADGRIEIDPDRPTGFRTPLEDEMVTGFASLLSAQTMFPVLSPDEMAGHYQENEISVLVRQGRITGPDGAWAAVTARVTAIAEYAARLKAVYPEIAAGRPAAFTDISNAIAAYMTFNFRSDTAPFDAALRGAAALSPEAARGMALFYGAAGCSTCHSGPLLTDMRFHAMGDPQIGPGKAERFESHQADIGRMRVTNNPDDAFAFRTPSLRNVTLTAPYGHAGAYHDLRAYLEHHAGLTGELNTYDIAAALLPALQTAKPDYAPAPSGARFDAIALADQRRAATLTQAEIQSLMDFLTALEDPIAASGGKMGIPDTVPSGLPIER